MVNCLMHFGWDNNHIYLGNDKHIYLREWQNKSWYVIAHFPKDTVHKSGQ